MSSDGHTDEFTDPQAQSADASNSATADPQDASGPSGLETLLSSEAIKALLGIEVNSSVGASESASLNTAGNLHASDFSIDDSTHQPFPSQEVHNHVVGNLESGSETFDVHSIAHVLSHGLGGSMQDTGDLHTALAQTASNTPPPSLEHLIDSVNLFDTVELEVGYVLDHHTS